MGKTNKKTKTLLLAIFLILSMLGTIYAANLIAKQLIAQKQQDFTKCEERKGNSYTASFNDKSVNPKVITAKLCDTLAIQNAGNKIRLVSFGAHDEHVVYDGVKEKLLRQNQSFTITLNKTGEYVFHDHYQEEVGGAFTVL